MAALTGWANPGPVTTLCGPSQLASAALSSPATGSTGVPDGLSQIRLTGSDFLNSVTLRTSLSPVETTLASADLADGTYALPMLSPQTTYVVTSSTSGSKICPGQAASRDVGTFTTR